MEYIFLVNVSSHAKFNIKLSIWRRKIDLFYVHWCLVILWVDLLQNRDEHPQAWCDHSLVFLDIGLIGSYH